MSYEAQLKDLRTGQVIKSFNYKDPVEAVDKLQKHIHIKYIGDFSIKIEPLELIVEPVHIDIEPIEIIIEELKVQIGGEKK